MGNGIPAIGIQGGVEEGDFHKAWTLGLVWGLPWARSRRYSLTYCSAMVWPLLARARFRDRPAMASRKPPSPIRDPRQASISAGSPQSKYRAVFPHISRRLPILAKARAQPCLAASMTASP